MTKIWMEYEWMRFQHKHRIPRLSHDANLVAFRSTRFLQLPYPMTTLLMTISIVLHWLVSEALFVGGPLNSTFLSIYFSPLALLLISLITVTMLIAITIVYFYPFPSEMPVMAGSARVVLDACCQLELPMPEGGIKWGDISTPSQRIAGFGEEAGKLTEGVSYPSAKIAEEDTDDD